ncbi:hypothetical protein KK120_07630 [Virgibacillus dakarensis]|nr:hypothetical protein [Virgibacillus dakarensis]
MNDQINDFNLLDLGDNQSDSISDYYKQQENQKAQFTKQVADLFMNILNKGEQSKQSDS